MMQWLSHMDQWHWLIIAGVLLVLEVLSGTGFLFWLGVAAGMTAIISWLVPSLLWTSQMLVFAGFAVTVAVLWWWYLRRKPLKSDRPHLNRRSEQYIGRVFTLEEAVVNGRGKITVDDSVWRISCQCDLSKGQQVKITASDGVILQAEPMLTNEDL